MNDIVDELAEALEASGAYVHEGRVAQKVGAGAATINGHNVLMALSAVVAKRMTARATEKAKWAAASPTNWVWEDGLGSPTRGTDGEYWATLQQGHGMVSVMVQKGGDVQGFGAPNMTLAKRGTEAHVAGLRERANR